MDEQTQSFLELSARDDLVQLVADKKAAWLFSADGARILWANSAGAAFFAAHSISDLTRLTALERSPARPHIARIADAGQADKFSIDRLRFYRGLRVMLLTCQCKRLELETGEAAALIVCGDKGLTATKDPLTGFAHLLASDASTVFVSAGGAVVELVGALSGTPEDLDLPAGQQALLGPIELNGTFHEGAVLKVSDRQKLIVLENEPLEDETDAESSADQASTAVLAAGSAVLAGGVAAATGTSSETDTGSTDEAAADETSAWVRADEADEDPNNTDELPGDARSDMDDLADADANVEAADPVVAETQGTSSEEARAEDLTPEETSEQASLDEAQELFEEASPGHDGLPPEDTHAQDPVASVEPSSDAEEDGSSDADAPSQTGPEREEDTGFVFQPRRRPVRFAWKMDVDQCFVFLSDEFADVLGPEATDIVGQTWAEVAERFDLDPRGQIARALDRRDTWSGKTVDWPVSGAALRVPVDMAALPAFDRDRKFEGYRGFGVCRTADAVQDVNNPTLTAGHAAATAIAASDVLSNEDTEDADQIEPAPTGETPSLEEPAPDLADPVEAGAEMDLEGQEADAAEDAFEPRQDDAESAQADSDPIAGSAAEKTEAGLPTKAEASLDDLKPAQPDSLAGKTFLGASAAALVGSLARFTGKSSSKAQEPVEAEPEPNVEVSEATPDDSGIDAEIAAAPAPETETSETSDDLPGAALDSKLAALQSGEKVEADVKEVSPEPEAEPVAEEEPGEAEGSTSETEEADSTTAVSENEHDEADDVEPAVATTPELEKSDASAEIADTGEQTDEETQEDAGENTEADPVATLTPDGEEPAGISGPAALAPAEIESAVKSLAKSYKAAEKKSRDLFDDAPAKQPDAEPVSHAEPETAADPHPEDGTAEEETVAEAALPEESMSNFEDAAAPADAEEDDDAVEAAAAELDEILQPDAIDDEASADADEREFFEETAAFETEDKAADAESGTETAEPERPTTGEVIPLATVKPRVVPVDTSGLSRPERAAFRKIAEALGARLEGDLDDFEEPDTVEDEPEDDLPPEVPEAGPIDPSLLDRLPIGIAIVHDREVLYANKALLAMIGYKSIAKLSQVGGLEALFIDDAEELPDAVGMDGEVDEAMKLRLADGGVLTVDAHMHSVPWNGSRGLMISITERKSPPASSPAAPASPNFFAEVRSELDNAHNQIAEMDTILETATDGVLVLDQHGTILKVNGSAEALFSANRSDMIGAPFTEFLAPESHRAAADYLDGLSRNGVASILNDGREVLGSVPAGGLIPLFMTMGRISGTEDEAKYCAVLRDITQWKTAEEELTQAKRQAEDASSAKSDFLAKISHEIRTPLNAIIGFSEVMMEERFGPIGNDRYKDYLKDIRTSGSHIMSLVNDLLDLSKIEAGKLDLKFSAVSTSDVINECVALMQPQANRERVIIRASLPEAVPNVVADPRSLRQIVLNLLSNAIKYNRSGGQVILSTALEGNGEVALRVRDTGTGMTAKQLTAALEPFRQLHTASRGGGTGLGLPLTKALVEANRASFHIDSTPDQGTLVEIVFPTQRVLAE